TVKKLSLELGGNAPFIVFDDAKLDDALESLMLAKFRNAGQTCICANRIYIQAGVYDELAGRPAQKVEGLKIGDGFSSDVQQGPLINESAIHKIQALLTEAVDQGAKIVVGGRVHENGKAFFQPTVIKNISEKMRISKEEIF